MKKYLSIFLVLLMVGGLMLTGCGSNDTEDTDSGDKDATYEIALVTDLGNIDDESFNQGTWEGVKQYGEDNDVTYNYYRPTEDSTESRIETIKSAIDKGAKVVVCPGFLFGEALATIQDDYPDVSFVGIDVTAFDMVNLDGKSVEVASNVALITYQEEQAGYFAGYAAVKDGYTKLGFLGGLDVPAVVRYGYGYVQGANAAAVEMGNVADISIKYWYCGGFQATDDIQTKMSGWYTEGTEVVFACGGGIYSSAVNAAGAADGKVIGVDVDQAAKSELIITSAMKTLSNSVVLALTDIFAEGTDYLGKVTNLGAADNCVGLPTADESWRLSTFTVDEYEALFDKVKSGEIEVFNGSDVNVKPEVEISVDYQN